jgi:hypothetical protein
MTFGIISNIVVGYLWVLQVGTQRHPSLRASRITSLAYGAGILQKFARRVSTSRHSRESAKLRTFVKDRQRQLQNALVNA